MADVSLNPSLFAILAGLVEDRTGIHYELRDSELFSSKVTTRAAEAGFESPLDYYYFLRYDDPGRKEFDALIEALVVNETYFFREFPQVEVLCSTMIRRAIRAGKKPRIWCAASSTGEEPLTLAMVLSESNDLENVEIVASDISERALQRAREGVYTSRSLRVIDDARRERWLTSVGEKFVVRQSLRDAISWRRVNLFDAPAVEALGRFDFVLCRNVLIYFSEENVRHVATTLAKSMHDDGTLLVGASESLLRFGTQLVCEEHGGAFFYRKAS